VDGWPNELALKPCGEGVVAFRSVFPASEFDEAPDGAPKALGTWFVLGNWNGFEWPPEGAPKILGVWFVVGTWNGFDEALDGAPKMPAIELEVGIAEGGEGLNESDTAGVWELNELLALVLLNGFEGANGLKVAEEEGAFVAVKLPVAKGLCDAGEEDLLGVFSFPERLLNRTWLLPRG
jgi:hypothetical protein